MTAPSIKYLSDGRKVCIIGQLNNVETIVQEIFCTATGDEIPSGERFVVKSLHDAPVESWRAKEEKRAEAAYKKSQKSLEDLNDKIRQSQLELSRISKLLRDSKLLLEYANSKPAEASLLAKFLTGTVQYMVNVSYPASKPVPMLDLLRPTDSTYTYDKDTFKLASVSGKSNGDLEYRIHHYADSSGNSCEYLPCDSYEAAVEKIRELCIEKHKKGYLYQSDIIALADLGIKLPPESVAEIKAKCLEAGQKTIETYREDLQKRVSNLAAQVASLDKLL